MFEHHSLTLIRADCLNKPPAFWLVFWPKLGYGFGYTTAKIPYWVLANGSPPTLWEIALEEEEKRRIREPLDSAVRRFAGLEGWDAAMDGLARVATWFLASSERMKADALVSLLETADPSEDIEPWLVTIENFGPVAREVLIEIAERARKALPAAPGGRRRRLTPERAAAACAFIGDLYAKGAVLDAAKRRAAQRFGVSRRTIQRVWEGRGKSQKAIFDLHEMVSRILVPEVEAFASLAPRTSANQKR